MSDGRRRAFLRGLAGLTLSPLACRPARPPLPAVPLSKLSSGDRIVIPVGNEPVEVKRTAESIEARSLLCTHMGCRVRWRPEREEYVCPCHEGRYDREGNVIEGMPSGPLRSIPFEIRDGAVVFPSGAGNGD